MGSPFDWLRNKMGPRVREKPTKDELEAARKEQATSGQGSVFDSLAEAEKAPEETQTIRWVNDDELLPRNADLKVRYQHEFLSRRSLTRVVFYSTNIPPRISKSLTESSTSSVARFRGSPLTPRSCK